MSKRFRCGRFVCIGKKHHERVKSINGGASRYIYYNENDQFCDMHKYLRKNFKISKQCKSWLVDHEKEKISFKEYPTVGCFMNKTRLNGNNIHMYICTDINEDPQQSGAFNRTKRKLSSANSSYSTNKRPKYNQERSNTSERHINNRHVNQKISYKNDSSRFNHRRERDVDQNDNQD